MYYQVDKLNWFIVAVFALVTLIIGLAIFAIYCVGIYRTRKLSNIIFGFMCGLLGTWSFIFGFLYFFLDVGIDTASFEDKNTFYSMVYISLVFGLIVSLGVLIALQYLKYKEGRKLENDLFDRFKKRDNQGS